MPKLRLPHLAVAVLAAMPAMAQVFPDALPANRSAAAVYSSRILALGELRFTDAQLYNLFDQGGSPIGLLENRKERARLSLGYSGTHRATPGDSLAIDHSDLSIPSVGFFQPGVFGATIYYLRESEEYRLRGGDTVETGANLFGLDMAAGPASGLIRVGFSAHGRLGGMQYPGDPERILLSVPSLRFDLGSRLNPALEMEVYAGFGGRFDSLKSSAANQERNAAVTFPRYGFLADVGGTETLPVLGNIVLEIGTDRRFGEYRIASDSGVQYPTVWTDYWTLQTQWMYPFQVQDFNLQPALRFAYRSEKAQGYKGIKGNQNAFKKGDKIDSLNLERGIIDFGLGGQFGFRDIVSLLLEWETAGHTFESDSTRKERYNRFSVGLEQHVDRLPFHFPEATSLTLRAGWTWRQDAKSRPGYRDFQFDPFISTPLPGLRPSQLIPKPDAPAGYSAFSLGFSLGLLGERIGVDGFLGLPKQLERVGTASAEASGTEFGASLTYRFL